MKYQNLFKPKESKETVIVKAFDAPKSKPDNDDLPKTGKHFQELMKKLRVKGKSQE